MTTGVSVHRYLCNYSATRLCRFHRHCRSSCQHLRLARRRRLWYSSDLPYKAKTPYYPHRKTHSDAFDMFSYRDRKDFNSASCNMHIDIFRRIPVIFEESLPPLKRNSIGSPSRSAYPSLCRALYHLSVPGHTKELSVRTAPLLLTTEVNNVRERLRRSHFATPRT